MSHGYLSKRLVWQAPDGRAQITRIPDYNQRAGETEDECIARLMPKIAASVPGCAFVGYTTATEHQTIHPQNCPLFRAAVYRGRLTHDMPKAREAWRDHLRALRKPKLEALDVEYQRADERGDSAAKLDIATKKQALRDVTADPRIDAAAMPEELKAVLPESLR